MKTVAWIPAGRASYLKILIPYLLKEKELLDRVFFCMNTENLEDINFITSICKQHPEYFDCLYLEDEVKPNGRVTVANFYKYFTDDDTIYLKIDDDVCFLQEGLLQELVRFRIQNERYLFVFANLINNVICSYIHQRLGALNYYFGLYQWDPFCKVGWESGEGAENAHDCFLAALKNGTWERFLFPMWELPDFVRISINLICYFGSDAKIFSRSIEGKDDEAFLTQLAPPILGRMNCIYGNKIGSHFAYYPQREYLENNTLLLEQYLRISLEK